MHEEGFISEAEFDILKRYGEFVRNNMQLQPNGIFLVDVDAKTALANVKKRGRFAELDITLDHLERERNRYRDWFYDDSGPVASKLMLDGNAHPEDVFEEFKFFKNTVDDLVKSPVMG